MTADFAFHGDNEYHLNAEVVHPAGEPTDYSMNSLTREDIAAQLAALGDDTEAY